MRGTRLIAVVFSLWFSAASSFAAEFPEKPVRLVNPFPASAGTIEVVARAVVERMSARLGQQVIIEYKPGAAGVIAARFAAAAPADGYTMYYGTSSTLGFSRLLQKDLGYDPLKNFSAVGMLGQVPVAIYATPNMGLNTVQEVIAFAKAKPGAIAFSSPGIGSVSQLAAEVLKSRAGIDMLHVPYPGNDTQMIDLSTGRIQLAFAGITGGLAFAKEGRIKLVATATRERSKLFPDVPAVGEFVKDYDAPAWMGIVVPRGTPAAAIDKLEGALMGALSEQWTKDQFVKAGVEMIPLGAKAFDRKMETDMAMWESILSKVNTKEMK